MMPKLTSAKEIINETLDIDEDEDERSKTRSLEVQLLKLFQGFQDPHHVRAFSKRSSPFVGTEYEPVLQELLAREFMPPTIKAELRRRFGKNKLFKTRNILGYIKSEILMKTDNLTIIKNLKWKYRIERIDEHVEIAREVRDRRKKYKSRKEELLSSIQKLYTRNGIMENQQVTHFNSQIERQISTNIELIQTLEGQVRLLEAEEKGIIIDAEAIRGETIRIVLGKCIEHLLPYVSEDSRKAALGALNVDLQEWVDTETRLNKLEEVKGSTSQQVRGLIPQGTKQ